jgi:hypothetical protein
MNTVANIPTVQIMINQPKSPALARGRFATELADFVRELARDVSDLSPQERQFLSDVARGEGRYKLVTLRRLAELSRRSPNLKHHESLAEIIRADTLAAERDESIDELMQEETRAQSECDLEQLRFARNPKCQTTIARLRQALRRQLAITRRMADCVNAL